uniref:LO6 n=1 Tax=Grenadier adomavirus TaxID=2609868 RepID=A0A6F9F1Y3_9VIRU|nr:TPA_asm: LO6 [Grenadier adomavirus]
MDRGTGVGPYYMPRAQGAGIGPFFNESRNAAGAWLQNQPGKRSWRHRRGRGGINWKQLARSAWTSLKQKFLPLLQTQGKKFLKAAASHAIHKGPEYFSQYKREGLGGVRNMFLDHLGTVATDFVRDATGEGRGSGPACDALTGVIQHARPLVASLLSSDACAQRSEGHHRAAGIFTTGGGHCDNDLVAIAPIQLALDIVMGQTAKHMSGAERGGFLPLVLPVLTGLAGSLMSSIPKWIEMARSRNRGGGGLVEEVASMFSEGNPFPAPPTHSAASRKRGGGGGPPLPPLCAVTDEGHTIMLSKRARPDTPIKLSIKVTTVKGGRPRVFYCNDASPFLS